MACAKVYYFFLIVFELLGKQHAHEQMSPVSFLLSLSFSLTPSTVPSPRSLPIRTLNLLHLWLTTHLRESSAAKGGMHLPTGSRYPISSFPVSFRNSPSHSPNTCALVYLT
jgi:hypothetical protein